MFKKEQEVKVVEPTSQMLKLQKILRKLSDELECSDQGIAMLRSHKIGTIRPLLAGVWSTTLRKNLMISHEKFEAIEKELLKSNSRILEVSLQAAAVEKSIKETIQEIGQEMKKGV